MFLVTRTQVRPNTSVNFFGQDNPDIIPGTLPHIQENYINTGKHTNPQRSLSADGLTLTMTVVWDTAASYESYKNDQVVIDGLINVSNAYCAAQGIILTLVSTEEI